MIAVAMYANYQDKYKTEDKPDEEKKTGGDTYKNRLNLYKNAIEQNRYHSISKLAKDYHIPEYTILQDLKKFQEEGYFQNIKIDYNKKEITYLDEAQSMNSKKKYNTKSKNVVAHMEDVVQQENTIPFYTKDSIQVETSPENQADYGNGKAEYNYIAEYPDTSHIWDDLNTELFPDTHDMKLCPSCGTENIIIRDATGKCYCFYCQEELS